MPKSSFQVFSDTNTKVVTVGYVGSSQGGGEKSSGKVSTERIETVHGSTAGASSSEFHTYLGSRNREKYRIEGMEALKQKHDEEQAFRDKVAENKRKDDERTKKNSLKRAKQKAKKQQQRKRAKGEDILNKSDHAVDNEEEEEEEEEMNEDDVQEY
mmetsp:Transcript_23968/g.40021  ORF Transcript_23968/g.40021 Transcript_23968/m.40021 type:complete len:156 (+) Transcript_23968:66-533(+)